MARYPPIDLSMTSAEPSAQVRHWTTSPTSTHATWADQCFAELHGGGGVPGRRETGRVDVPASRPSNDPGRANRYAGNRNAAAPRLCPCRRVRRRMASPPPRSLTWISQSPRQAWVAPYHRYSSRLRRGVASPKGNKLPTYESSAVLKDNMLVRFTISVSKRRFPPERLCPVSDLNDHPASERV